MVKGLNLNFKKDSNQSVKPINKFIIDRSISYNIHISH